MLRTPADVSDANAREPEPASVVQGPAALLLTQLREVLPRQTAAEHTRSSMFFCQVST